ncbi:MAG: hypothetical protein BROFUL_00258 [Candidatus Brocadia fulgida]|uniref:Uncharacterized protein n=1 Tax=Candidatus Brocadia fulgida TaxID=380242 RepID=A0A0M2V2U6_9BACT|nr:MAG: hypothetical protein BROFUL_00258 [Candidatus Brocadia fulgida]MBV6518468.1 hypothetical protein [Candidatus Brocadia fulgida]
MKVTEKTLENKHARCYILIILLNFLAVLTVENFILFYPLEEKNVEKWEVH